MSDTILNIVESFMYDNLRQNAENRDFSDFRVFAGFVFLGIGIVFDSNGTNIKATEADKEQG